MQLSSSMALLPTPLFSLSQQNLVSPRCAQLRLLLQQRGQKLAEEHLPQYHQDWSYLDDVGTGGGVDNQTWEMAFGCPLSVGLVGEGCHLEMRVKNLDLIRSCSTVPEEAHQSHLGQRNLDLRLAVAEKEGLMAGVRVEEVLVLSKDP